MRRRIKAPRVVPDHVLVELLRASRKGNRGRVLELLEQIRRAIVDGDPDPADHADYGLWS